MLETVNYIEHWGLERAPAPDWEAADASTAGGAPVRYERVAPHHSWNANTLATNTISFRLQRHADHHAHSERPYPRLRDMPAAPQFPKGLGYPSAMLLAMVPAAWFAVMGPRVAAERARK